MDIKGKIHLVCLSMQAFFLSFPSLVLNLPDNRAPYMELESIGNLFPYQDKGTNDSEIPYQYMDPLLFGVLIKETKSTALHRKGECQEILMKLPSRDQPHL